MRYFKTILQFLPTVSNLLSKHFFEIGQNKAIFHLVLGYPCDRLTDASLRDSNGLYHGKQLFFCGQLQHRQAFRPITNVRSTYRAPVAHQGPHRESRQGSVWNAYLVERTTNLAKRQILGDIEFVGPVCRVEDKIKGVSMGVCPGWRVVDYKGLRAQSQCVVPLAGRMRYHRNLGTQCSSELDCEMTQSSQPDYADLRSWSDLGAHERRPYRQSRTEQWRRGLRGDAVWDREDKVLVSPYVRCIAALGDGLV